MGIIQVPDIIEDIIYFLLCHIRKIGVYINDIWLFLSSFEEHYVSLENIL